MQLRDLLGESWSNIVSNPLRSILSVLGVVFGVSSIVAMVGVGVGAEREIDRMIASLGARNLHVSPVKPGPSQLRRSLALSYGLSDRDVEALHNIFPGASVSRVSRRAIRQLNRSHPYSTIDILGVDNSFFDVASLNLAAGRWISPVEASLGVPVVVLGATLAEVLFDDLENVVGSKLRLDEVWVEVIGVLGVGTESQEPKAAKPQRGSPDSQESGGEEALAGVEVGDLFVTSFAMLEKRFGPTQVMERYERLIVQLDEDSEPLEAKKLAESTLGHLHRGADLYRVSAAESIIAQRREASRLFSYFLLIIATISLVVGAIGIANVMLAAVAERVREIGLRRALGARERDILRQFLAESTCVCLVGAGVGYVMGAAVAVAAGYWTGWSIFLPWWSVLVSLGLALIVGSGAGIFPALAASRISPIEALEGRPS